jgi:uncharacterized repeat protein (TIGR01451 family)
MVFRREGTYGLVALIVTLFAFVLLSEPAWAQAELTVEKRGNPGSVQVGQNITYTIQVSNTGDTDNARNVQLVDMLPANTDFSSSSDDCAELTTGIITCDLGNIRPGTTNSRTVEIVVTAREAGTATNTATALSSNAKPAFDTEPTEVRGAPPPPPPRVEVTIANDDNPDALRVGGLLAYTLTVSNSGPGDAQNVTVVDTLPDQVDFVVATATRGGDNACTETDGVVTCSLGNVPQGTATVTILVEAAQEGTALNSAVVSDTNDSNTANNTATAETEINDGGGRRFDRDRFDRDRFDRLPPGFLPPDFFEEDEFDDDGFDGDEDIDEDEDDVDSSVTSTDDCIETFDTDDTEDSDTEDSFEENDTGDADTESASLERIDFETVAFQTNNGTDDTDEFSEEEDSFETEDFDEDEDIEDDLDTDALDECEDEGDDGVSATADDGQAEASTPGASARSGGDPDDLKPRRDVPDDVVDEVTTIGELPNTDGISLLVLALTTAPSIGGLVMFWAVVVRRAEV